MLTNRIWGVALVGVGLMLACGGEATLGKGSVPPGTEGIARVYSTAATPDAGHVALAPPVNDECGGAIDVGALPATVMGDTTEATTDDPGFCGVSAPNQNVWYTVVGTGNTLTADTCTDTSFDTKLNVFCGACGYYICIGGNDDSCGLQSSVSWCSEPGQTYYINVGGYGSSSGTFTLTVTDDGTPCADPPVCDLPIGACCVDADCFQLDPAECAAAGGTFLGDGIPCDPNPCGMGACCFDDGSCQDLSEGDCLAAGGSYQGNGSSCATVSCPQVGDNCDNPLVIDFATVTLPHVDTNTTCGRANDYDGTCLGSYDGGEDIIYELLIPDAITIDLTLDPEGTSWTGLALAADCTFVTCLTSVTSSGSAPYGTGCVELAAGTYYVMIDTWPSPDCIPSFTLTIEECVPCDVACPGGATPENEADCGLPEDTVNGGCNADPAVFTPIECGETYCGTAAWDGSLRDTDWYAVTLTEESSVTWSATAEFTVVVGYVLTDPLESLDCADVQGLSPAATAVACEEASITTACLPPGEHWFFVAPDFSNPPFACGAEYFATLTCETCVPPVNDDCAGAELIDTLPASVVFDNTFATDGVAEPCGVSSGPFKEVWYRVVGNGNTLTATTCNAGTEVSDTKISVFCGTCEHLVCVAGNDDACIDFGSYLSTVSWCSAPGIEYYIAIGNYSAFTAAGVIQLDVFDEGVACGDPVDCRLGACCVGVDCVDTTTELECVDTLGGVWYEGETCDIFTCPEPEEFEVALVPEDGCVRPGVDQLVVRVDMRNAPTIVVGGQFFLSYDVTKLDFLSVVPGEFPFTLEIYAAVDETLGTINYAVGKPDGESGTDEDRTMAYLTFDVLESGCALEDLITFRPFDPPTRLSDQFGQPLYPILLDLEQVSFDEVAPVITVFPADEAYECASEVPAADIGLVEATDDCTLVTITHEGDTDNGGSGCIGDPLVITRTYRATDACGNYVEQDQTFTIADETAPVIADCPTDITVYADAPGCTAVVTWTEPTASDNCGDVVLTSSHNPGDVFDQGVTTVTYTATDACGLTSDCSFNVEVLAFNELIVSVELSPIIAATELTRCITFELWNCAAGDLTPRMTVEEEITFTNGLALDVPIAVPCDLDGYDCITVRDRLHTLRRTDESFGVVGNQYVASCVGDPAGGGDWLIGGNLNDDRYIDILDFGTYSWLWSTLYDSDGNGTDDGDTPCGLYSIHADIDGNGVVDTADFTFVQINFLLQHEANCCGVALALPDEGPVTEIAVKELHRRGLSHLAAGDLNGDGWLDIDDVVAFMQGARPRPEVGPTSQQKSGPTVGERVRSSQRRR